jgi:CHAT domain-containing protein
MSNFGLNLYKAGKIDDAQDVYFQIIKTKKKRIEQKMLFLSEKELDSYWNTLRRYSVAFKSFLYDYQGHIPASSGFIYDYELFSKALLLNSSRFIRRSIIENGGEKTLNAIKAHEEEVINYENELISYFEVSSSYELHAYLLNSDDAKLIKLSELIEEQKNVNNQAKKRLALEYAELNQFNSELSMQWQAIQKALSENEVAIEFLSFSYFDIQTLRVQDTLYGALLLCADDPYPQFIPLCNAQELQNALRASKHDANALYPIIWQPIEAHLNGATDIYIAPSGLLHTVSFAGIKKGNRYLCEDYMIHNLLSTKDVIRLKTMESNSNASNHAVLFGGSDYSLSMKDLNLLLTHQETSGLTNLTRSMLDYMDPTRGQGFSYLPGSQREVQTIEQLLSGNDWKAMLYTDINATETVFKSVSAKADSPSPRLIHISTHGFFMPLPENRYDENDFLMTGESKWSIYRLSDNPLMRTGLAFTGGNHVWRGGEVESGVDDGILTAYEISNMNLSNTELVVLSACNTGLGDINGSEGVFGLQRAFRLAGVQTMIVSLWEVPDKETVELMSEFYSLWTQGLDKKKAFTRAQLKMRHLYPDYPEKWAGFIMIE